MFVRFRKTQFTLWDKDKTSCDFVERLDSVVLFAILPHFFKMLSCGTAECIRCKWCKQEIPQCYPYGTVAFINSGDSAISIVRKIATPP